MNATSPSHLTRAINIGLRLASLGSKLILTLYIARYLTLSSMGYYGLVNGTVLILMVALGMRLDYVVARELVGASPLAALTKMRDQMLFYTFTQLVLAVIMGMLVATGITGISGKVLLVIFVLSVLENWGDTIFINLISMGRPLIANAMFFIRSALWVFPVMGLGLLYPEYRTSRTVFTAWMIGSLGGTLLVLYLWRDMPWRKALRTPVNWQWIKITVQRSFFIWIGALAGTSGFFIDRYVLAGKMTLELVGVATFYTSFGGALFSLIHSGVLSFAYPQLIALHREKDKTAYHHAVYKLAWHVAVLAGVLGIIMGIVVPLAGRYFNRPELAAHASRLWLILFATWLRCNAETLYYILFSRNQDKSLWVGGLLYLLPSLGCNLVLVPLIGFSGVGYSAIASSLFLLAWRGWHVYKNTGVSTGIHPELNA